MAGIDNNRIIGLVFDTTSVNSGSIGGIAIRLQREFSHELAELACRHHIYEILCGEAGKLTYGDTKSPSNQIFTIICRIWNSLNKSQYDICDLRRVNRAMTSDISSTIEFCKLGIVNPDFTYRDDYKELLQLTVIYLGGKFESGFTFKAPSSRSNARWMSKVIYTIKIALFRKQLTHVIDEDLLKKICDLALFYCISYTTEWFKAPKPFDCASNDLNLFKKLTRLVSVKGISDFHRDIFTKVVQKLENHLWYLSERLVILSLFSKNVGNAEKNKKHQNPLCEQKMPQLTQKTIISDLIGPDSWSIFNCMGVFPVFFKKSSSKWQNDENYQYFYDQL